jgi:hypothetical protein
MFFLVPLPAEMLSTLSKGACLLDMCFFVKWKQFVLVTLDSAIPEKKFMSRPENFVPCYWCSSVTYSLTNTHNKSGDQFHRVDAASSTYIMYIHKAAIVRLVP